MTKPLPIQNVTAGTYLEALQDNSNWPVCFKISYEKMRWLCRYPVWNMIGKFIGSTRSYHEGLALSVALISTAKRSSKRMTPSEYELYRDRLWEFHLDMLDKLDLWSEYLACFAKLRSELSYSHKWNRSSGMERHPDLSHYLCGEGPDHLLVHFLIGRHERKQIIERKLQRQRIGKSATHLRHHSKNSLSPDELRKRVKFLVEKFTPYMPLC